MNNPNDPNRRSWMKVPEGSDFPIQNLPFGVFEAGGRPPRIGVAIGDLVLDLFTLADKKLIGLPDFVLAALKRENLNELASLGRAATRALREEISDLLTEGNTVLADFPEGYGQFFFLRSSVRMCLPFLVGDYTDFYSSIEHATNVGTMFRGKDNALMPNWRHLPVGYHGRSSSIVVSGTPVRRPKGQMLPADSGVPMYGPTKLLDFELEMAFACGKASSLGEYIPVDKAEEHIFGMMIFNDWSARDIQSWEYVPLGPFLGKNFASALSPWVVTMDALEPFRVAGPVQEPIVLPYLHSTNPANFDIRLEVLIEPAGGKPYTVCRSNFKHMYWSMQQQLAHHTVGGCNMNPGDICASGTISGPTEGSYGSMLELTWRGTKPIRLPDGSERKFIHDGDTVIMRAYCEKAGQRIGFGEVRNLVLPAH